MSTHYIMFVHGVNTHDIREKPSYADDLISLIKQSRLVEAINLKFIPLFWGDVIKQAECDVLTKLQQSPLWKQMWFQTFREKQLLQFAGDAALYISRFIGAQVVEQLKKQAVDQLTGFQPDDQLHLVTHSWGTVILFDILFAARWDAVNAPGQNDVMAIRDIIFGVPGGKEDPLKGIRLASVHTMGSPIAIFSLIDVVKATNTIDPTSKSQHDITPRLQELLKNLYGNNGKQKLPWKNFIHPGDPIAYPLKEIIIDLVDPNSKFLDVQDLITHEAGLFDYLTEPFSQTVLALLHGGDAHGSYWRSKKVSEEIIECLRS
ncbi:MAG: hypothetical protein HWQ44_00510 [Nostoc sp. JL34]|uniref:hypothetical protein n=1 Tax=Nostoc sp. JL34 TaxID=2815397 RepID=UPI001D347376|nr:hypothetical protein [Nostoc sp. JL34]MBN3881495.1 hypothetical protein [Nostoc sp. JL34]